MTRTERRWIVLAVALSGVAGFVDALGFIALGGFFVSFMTGNSTRLGVGLGGDALAHALTAGSLILLFLLGVMLGSALGFLAGSARRVAVLVGVATLLSAAALAQQLGFTALALGLMPVAMGAENAVFERDGEVSIGLTYMTGTLVKCAQRLTGALLGGPRWRWLPYLCLWLGLVCGAVLGALGFARLGLGAGLGLAAAATGALAVVAGWMERR